MLEAKWLRPAIDETREAFQWYLERNPAAAGRFEALINETVDKVRQFPMRYAVHLEGTRKVFLRRFPYVLIYLVEADHVLVIAVHHCSRDPKYWLNRL